MGWADSYGNLSGGAGQGPQFGRNQPTQFGTSGNAFAGLAQSTAAGTASRFGQIAGGVMNFDNVLRDYAQLGNTALSATGALGDRSIGEVGGTGRASIGAYGNMGTTSMAEKEATERQEGVNEIAMARLAQEEKARKAAQTPGWANALGIGTTLAKTAASFIPGIGPALGTALNGASAISKGIG